MSAVEAYLAELRASLGDRLPLTVQTARLREIRAHLLESSADVGEAEAIRRYGRARAIANDLVRSHHRYDERSSWTLSILITVGLLLSGIVHLLQLGFDVFDQNPWFIRIDRGWYFLLVVIFCGRVVQTRRWLATPVALTHFALAMLLAAIFSLLPQRLDEIEIGNDGPSIKRLNPAETKRLLAAHPEMRQPKIMVGMDEISRDFVQYSVPWVLLNVASLGLGSLFDLRRVRRKEAV